MAVRLDFVLEPGKYKLKGQRLCNLGLAPYTSLCWTHEVDKVE